jgi:hypothetical protein
MKVFSAVPRKLVDRWEAVQTLSPRQVVDFHYHDVEEWLTVVRGGITFSTLADAPFFPERSRERQRLALEVLDPLAAGVLILDGEAHALFANTATREIAAAKDVLVLKDGTVRPRQREQGDVFRRLVGSAIPGKPGGSLLLSRPSRRLPVSALVTPLAGTLVTPLAGTLVVSPCSPRPAGRRCGFPVRPGTPSCHFNRTSAAVAQAQSYRGARGLAVTRSGSGNIP